MSRRWLPFQIGFAAASVACSGGEPAPEVTAAEEILPYGASVRFREDAGTRWIEGLVGRLGECTALMVPLDGGGFRPVLLSGVAEIEIQRSSAEDGGSSELKEPPSSIEWVSLPADEVRKAGNACSPF